VYDQSFLRSHLETACYSEEWWSWSVVAILGLAMVTIPPLVMLLVVYRALRSFWNPDDHPLERLQIEWSKEQFDDYLSHWTLSFRPEAWWFQTFRLERKVTFACVVTAIHDPGSQVFATLMVLIMCMLTTSLSRPFKFEHIDLLDICGQFSIALCILVAATFCGTRSDPHDNVVAAVSIFVIVGSNVVIAVAAGSFIMIRSGCWDSHSSFAKRRSETEMTDLSHPLPERLTRSRASEIFNVDFPDAAEFSTSDARGISAQPRKESTGSFDVVVPEDFDEQFSSHLNRMDDGGNQRRDNFTDVSLKA
jgi:hypothetical protein